VEQVVAVEQPVVGRGPADAEAAGTLVVFMASDEGKTIFADTGVE